MFLVDNIRPKLIPFCPEETVKATVYADAFFLEGEKAGLLPTGCLPPEKPSSPRLRSSPSFSHCLRQVSSACRRSGSPGSTTQRAKRPSKKDTGRTQTSTGCWRPSGPWPPAKRGRPSSTGSRLPPTFRDRLGPAPSPDRRHIGHLCESSVRPELSQLRRSHRHARRVRLCEHATSPQLRGEILSRRAVIAHYHPKGCTLLALHGRRVLACCDVHFCAN